MLRSVPIRWRLAAAFAAAMAALLVALGAFVYTRVNDALRRSVDQALRAQAQETTGHAREGTFLDADARDSGTIAELVDARGRVLRSDPAGLPRLVGLQTLAAARSAPQLTTVSHGLGEHNRWRSLAVRDRGQILVVARSLRQTEETLHHLFRGLLVAGPVGLLLATLGGYGLAAAALRPVESMRRRASAISARTPGSRLPVPPSRDEVHDLAVTLNEMLERLEAALEHERRFVADASHELRTPLSLLKTELEIALRRPRSAGELRAAVASAAEETDRLIRLAEDLLLIARSDQSELPLLPERLDVARLLGRTAARFDERARAAGRRVVVAPTAGAVLVVADPLRLEQALGNLVDNALTHGAGTVTMTAKSNGRVVELHVADEGAGVPPEFAARAFERFSRADPARSRGGSGLGLAIVRAIAAAHGGATGLRADATGTDVWLSLPVRDDLS